MPRHRAQFGMLGTLIGTLFGVVAALLINSRRAVPQGRA
jgi:ABC-type lipoprotein release transport system permease subunit